MSDTEKKVEWAWSVYDSEEADGPYENRDAAYDAARQWLRDNVGAPYEETIILGHVVYPNPAQCVVFDHVVEIACEEAEDFHYDVDNEIFEPLDGASEALAEWARKYLKPVAWVVVEVEKIVIAEKEVPRE